MWPGVDIDVEPHCPHPFPRSLSAFRLAEHCKKRQLLKSGIAGDFQSLPLQYKNVCFRVRVPRSGQTALGPGLLGRERYTKSSSNVCSCRKSTFADLSANDGFVPDLVDRGRRRSSERMTAIRSRLARSNGRYGGDSSPASRSAKFSEIAAKHISHSFGIGLRFQRAPVAFPKSSRRLLRRCPASSRSGVPRLGSTSHDALEKEVAKCYLIGWR